MGAGERRVVETGSLRRGGERTAPIPIGGRVAEAGALAPRGHANGLPATVVEDDDDGLEDMDLGGPDVDPDGVLIPPVLSRTVRARHEWDAVSQVALRSTACNQSVLVSGLFLVCSTLPIRKCVVAEYN